MTSRITSQDRRIELVGDTTINGNLTVSGTTTTVNSEVTTIADPVLELGSVDGEPAIFNDGMDKGIMFNWNENSTIGQDSPATSRVGFFGFDRTTQRFVFIPRANESGDDNTFTGDLGEIDALLDWENIRNSPDNLEDLGITFNEANGRIAVYQDGNLTSDASLFLDSGNLHVPNSIRNSLFTSLSTVLLGVDNDVSLFSLSVYNSEIDDTATLTIRSGNAGLDVADLMSFNDAIVLNQNNTKTINGESIHGVGDIVISTGSPADGPVGRIQISDGAGGFTSSSALTTTNVGVDDIQVNTITGFGAGSLNMSWANPSGLGSVASISLSADSDPEQASILFQMQPDSGAGYTTRLYLDASAPAPRYLSNTGLHTMWHEGNFDPASKQDTLISGTNIKTINGENILGSGNLVIADGGAASSGALGSIQLSDGTGGFTSNIDLTSSNIGVPDLRTNTLSSLGGGSLVTSWTNPSGLGSVSSITLSADSDPEQASILFQMQPDSGVGYTTRLYLDASAPAPRYLNNTGLHTMWHAGNFDPASKQDTLISGTNIKTINGSSVLGSGDLVVSAPAFNGVLTGNNPFFELNNTVLGSTDFRLRAGTLGASVFDFFSVTDSKTIARFDTDGRLALNSSTMPDEATVFVVGHGSNGANVDARGANQFHSSTFDAQSHDFGTTGTSVFLQYLGSGLTLTSVLDTAISSANLAQLVAQGNVANFAIYTSNSAPLIFGTNNIERMRLLTNGNLAIGKTTASYTVDVDGTVNATGFALNGTPISPGGTSAGALGLIQLSDGAGGFTANAALSSTSIAVDELVSGVLRNESTGSTNITWSVFGTNTESRITMESFGAPELASIQLQARPEVGFGYTTRFYVVANEVAPKYLNDTGLHDMWHTGNLDPEAFSLVVQESNYNFLVTDGGKLFTKRTSATPTYTIPTNATQPIKVGTHIRIFNDDISGDITLEAASGVDLFENGVTTVSTTVAVPPKTQALLIKTNTNTWTVRI